ncbi:MAG: TerC family protein [Asticcacaulis sp.]
MMDSLNSFFVGMTDPAQLWALGQVLFIDIVLAGDNAVAVGLAAAGLDAKQRRQAILYGLIAAVVLRVGFALVAVELMQVIGLVLAGGILLLWVCWKMWRELREQEAEAQAEANLEDATGIDVNSSGSLSGAAVTPAPRKTFMQALIQILIADLSMSIDNVLAVAGAARHHPEVLVFGLLLSVALMGIAATYIAKVLHKYRWIGYVGLAIIVFVAVKMIWEGGEQVLHALT